MGRINSRYWTAQVPTSAELKRMRKEHEKAKRDLATLRAKEVLYEDIKKKQRDIKALRQQQSKLGRLLNRAKSEWKSTESLRKRIVKEYKRL